MIERHHKGKGAAGGAGAAAKGAGGAGLGGLAALFGGGEEAAEAGAAKERRHHKGKGAAAGTSQFLYLIFDLNHCVCTLPSYGPGTFSSNNVYSICLRLL